MPDDNPWMDRLEAKVEAAVEEIGRLRAENADLREAVSAARAGSADGSPAAEEDAAAWKKERVEVQGRVEGIVERLEGLLGEE